jgi:hypothetical protein
VDGARKVEEPDFTLADLIGEISGEVICDEDFEPDPQGFYTTNEIAEATGLRVRIVRKMLRRLKKAGNLEVGKKRTVLLNDSIRVADAYRLVNWPNEDQDVRDFAKRGV